MSVSNFSSLNQSTNSQGDYHNLEIQYYHCSLFLYLVTLSEENDSNQIVVPEKIIISDGMMLAT